MRARRAASAAGAKIDLPPKPPPMSGVTTRIADSSSSNLDASSLRSPNGRWAPAQTVSESPSHSATAARGSIGMIEMYGR